jgi:hypothetical protein
MLEDLATYIDTNYVRGHPARGRKRVVPQQFGPNVWNLYEMVLYRSQGNTMLEDSITFFRKMIVICASMWKFLEYIQKYQERIKF